MLDGTVTTGIDFALFPHRVLKGRVTDAATGEGIPGVDIWYFIENFAFVPHRQTVTDGEGRYEFRGVTASKVRLGTQNTSGHRNLGWPSASCLDLFSCRDGSDVLLGFEEVRSGLDFALTAGAGASGRVIDVRYPTLSVFAEVSVYDSGGNRLWFGRSRADGRWGTPALPPGLYYARAQLGLDCEVWASRRCIPQSPYIDFAEATPIVLDAAIVRDIDFEMPHQPVFSSGFE